LNLAPQSHLSLCRREIRRRSALRVHFVWGHPAAMRRRGDRSAPILPN